MEKAENLPYRQPVIEVMTALTIASSKKWGKYIPIIALTAAAVGAKCLPPTVIECLLFPKERRNDWTREFSHTVGGRFHFGRT